MAAATTAWVALVVAGLVVGTATVTHRDELALRAAPLAGRWDLHLGAGLAAAATLAAVVVAAGPRLAATARWGWLVCVASVGSVAWATVLAASRGWATVSEPLATRFEYLAVVGRIDGPGSFLRTYTDRLGEYPTHVKGHPPGLALLLWGMDRAHLQGPGWATALVLAGAGMATGATLVTVRSVAGEHVARRAAPFVVLAPAAVWLATSADALFAGVGALGLALVLAGRRLATAVAGGMVLAAALHLSYGIAVLLVVPAAVLVARRDARTLAGAAVGAAAVTAAFSAGGFWWFDGLEATRALYEEGVARDRPYGLFAALINPAALAIALGPAVAAGFAVGAAERRAGRAAAWALPVAAAGAVVVADLTGLSKGEVERIWLPFMPWLLTAAATVPRPRLWLAAQAAVALALQASLDSPW